MFQSVLITGIRRIYFNVIHLNFAYTMLIYEFNFILKINSKHFHIVLLYCLFGLYNGSTCLFANKNHIFTCYRINFKLQKVKLMTYFIFFHFYSTKIKRRLIFTCRSLHLAYSVA
jgi:hypothetical protein